MGGHFYSSTDRATRAASKGYHTKSRQEIFSSRLHESMNPKDVSLREARDSEQHPLSFPMILGLDFTGSMGHTPHALIKDGLPHLITSLIQRGIPDIALCFIGIGDHITDSAPLQIGQFESGDEQLDTWLERSWLESGGGGNDGESYLLALAFAAFVCQTDQWDKRQQKGVIVTVGDEPPLMNLSKADAITIFGGQARDWFQGDSISAEQLMERVRDKWVVYHLHVNHGGYYDGKISKRWTDLLGQERVMVADSPENVPEQLVNIAFAVAQSAGNQTGVPTIDPTASDDLTSSDPDNGRESAASPQTTPSESANASKTEAEVETI